MGIRKFVRNWLGGGINSLLSFLKMPTQAGVDVNETNVIGLSAYWCGVNQIADGLMNMPLTIRRIEEGGERKRGREHSVIAAPRFMRQIRQGAIDVVADDHPINALLAGGVYSYLDETDFVRLIAYHLLTHGNSYWKIDSNSRGQVMSLQPLLPERTRPHVNQDSGQIEYQVMATDENGDRKTLKDEEVLHFKGLSRDGIYGLSPIRVLREDLGLALAANRYGARFFANDATPTTVLQTESDTLTEDEMDLMLDRWDRDQGGENQRSTAVLWGGVTAQRIGLPPEDSQFLETRVHSVLDVARMLGCNPSKLYEMSRATYNNVVQENISFGNDTLRPHATRMCAAIDSQLLGNDPNYFCAFDASNMQWADQLARFRAYEIGIRSKFYSAIEARRSEGLPDEMPDDGMGDDEPDMPDDEPEPDAPEEDDMRRRATRVEVDADAFMQDVVDGFDEALVEATSEYGKELEGFFEDVAGEIYDGNTDSMSKWVTIAVESDEDLATLADDVDALFDTVKVNELRDGNLTPIYEELTETVMERAVGTVNSSLGVSINLPDPVQRQIIADGGKRVGLIDVSQQNKDALFRALHTARSEGMGVPEAGKLLREHLEAGPYTNAGVDYRAHMVARTEAKHAQRVSSLATYGEAGWEVMALDAQLGADVSDPDCIARNGQTFTVEEAAKETDSASVHPNCTLTWIPHIP